LAHRSPGGIDIDDVVEAKLRTIVDTGLGFENRVIAALHRSKNYPARSDPFQYRGNGRSAAPP